MLDELEVKKNITLYNIGLVFVGFLGLITYIIIGSLLIPSAEFEVTIFKIAFQGFFYLIFMILANIGYRLVDAVYNKTENEDLVHKIIYYVISVLLI